MTIKDKIALFKRNNEEQNYYTNSHDENHNLVSYPYLEYSHRQIHLKFNNSKI